MLEGFPSMKLLRCAASALFLWSILKSGNSDAAEKAGT